MRSASRGPIALQWVWIALRCCEHGLKKTKQKQQHQITKAHTHLKQNLTEAAPLWAPSVVANNKTHASEAPSAASAFCSHRRRSAVIQFVSGFLFSAHFLASLLPSTPGPLVLLRPDRLARPMEPSGTMLMLIAFDPKGPDALCLQATTGERERKKKLTWRGDLQGNDNKNKVPVLKNRFRLGKKEASRGRMRPASGRELFKDDFWQGSRRRKRGGGKRETGGGGGEEGRGGDIWGMKRTNQTQIRRPEWNWVT